VPKSLKPLLIRLYKDAAFRKSFAQNPRAVLRDLGFSVASLSLPERIPLKDLERHMLLQARDQGPRLTLREIASLPDEEVWSRYRQKIQPVGPPPLFLSKSPARPVPPVAVYAVSIATLVAAGLTEAGLDDEES
jgi:hypothetical protein